MFGVIFGLICIAGAVYAILPSGFGWSVFVLQFLKGFAPVLAVCVGIVALLVGIADIKDKAEAGKEERIDTSDK